MNRNRSRAAVILTAAALGLAIGACGEDDPAPTTRTTGNGTDRGFAATMIPHHQSAVDMAKIAETKGDHAETKQMGTSIVASQTAEITQMTHAIARFEAAGIKEKSLGVPDHAMGMGGDASMLESARPFDREFIDMMIPHHQGAIRMARVELEKGKDPEMRKLATAIVEAQTHEIDEMNLWRVSWFGKASPAGGVPAEGDTGMQHDM
jgi:uncharacterized protein (DUF305 family)